ncbi:MAG: DUF2062 domain-containing protein [Pseudomonadota bacterium]
MVFRRRDRPGIWSRLRAYIAPRKGWRRGLEYLGHRVKRIPDSPHRIAIGLASGAFVSFSPLFGLHFFYAAGLAWLVRGNVIAGLIGTVLGNPLTFPAIAAASLGTGRWILGSSGRAIDFGEISAAFSEAVAGLWQTGRSWFGYGEPALDRLSAFGTEIFLPYLVGGLFTGGICAVATYFLSRPVIAAYQNRRRLRLMVRAREKMRSMERARAKVRQRLRKTVAKPDAAE